LTLAPPRKAILYAVDPLTGRTYPIETTIVTQDSGTFALINAMVKSRFKTTIMSYTCGATFSSSSYDIDLSDVSALEIELQVTSVSGTNPSLSVYIEGKFEYTSDYKPLVYKENITTTGIWWFTITQLAFRYVRIRWVVSGTNPRFTFTVTGQAMA